MPKGPSKTKYIHGTLAEKFNAKIKRGDGCWLWQASVTADGYGRMGIGGPGNKRMLAHRVAWQLYVGKIPDGMLVLHKCDNPPCCNPKHLFLGTDADNARDMSRKGRHPGSKKTHCPKGHPYSGRNLRLAVRQNSDGRKNNRVCKTCVNASALRSYYKFYKKYGMSPITAKRRGII